MSGKFLLACLTAALGGMHAPLARAGGQLDLPAIKPVGSCEALAGVDLARAAATPLTFTARLLQTPKGAFCKVAGTIETGNSFEIDLPVEHWTQRYVQSAQGNVAINNAGSCAPANQGELVVGVNSRTGSRQRENWQADPRQRLAFAYLLNHQTALIAKALIRAFYGQPQRFAYFTGCSGGGREVLIELQRFPADFDGATVGAPNVLLSIHNGGFYHGWEAHVNTRPDGSLILTRARLGLLHEAVIAHCARVADAMDGILQMPTACRFDPAWVLCKKATQDRSHCLSAEEAAVAQKLYRGATDDKGRGFDTAGYPLGSELLWPLGLQAGGAGDATGDELRYLLPLSYAGRSSQALAQAFRFDTTWFDRVRELAPLYDGADTDLRPFRQHGGKLLLWQGAEDPVVQQQSTIAYYQGVQKVLGEQATDGFMRLFLLPGVAHCGGGEGPAQVDVLSPLMGWVEQGQRPDMLVAGRPEGQTSAIPGEKGQAPKALRYPFAAADLPVALRRPVFPFPHVARYDGKGGRNDPASYAAVRSQLAVPEVIDSRAMALIGPDNHAFYRIENGQLVADAAAASRP